MTRCPRVATRLAVAAALLVACRATLGLGEEAAWPQWRGPGATGIAHQSRPPRRWSLDNGKHVLWRVAVEGQGASSPVIAAGRLYLTTSFELGARRAVLALDPETGERFWMREIEDDNPELASSLTGHAASTPATDGQRVVAWFGNAGLVCYSREGELLWRRDLGEFETELGLASSPVIDQQRLYLVCDHDGDRFHSFDSFVACFRLDDGETIWKTDRPRVFRSWSTPILAPGGERGVLVIGAESETRGYDADTGRLLWSREGISGWVAPTPVLADGVFYSVSGRDGPTVALRLRGQQSPEELWRFDGGAPYVCSPVAYEGRLFAHHENGVLTCRDAADGRVLYRERLGGRFTASGVMAGGALYLANEEGEVSVVAPGDAFHLLARNTLGGAVLASPAVWNDRLYFRTERELICVGRAGDAR